MTLTISDYIFIEPDWEKGILYKRKWDTRFQTSITGNETRSGLFSYPRVSFIFTLFLTDAIESNYIKRKIYKNLHNVWGIPYWTDRTYLSAQAISGQPVINVNEAAYRNFEVGGQLVILENTNSYEVKTIQSISSNEITLTENLTASWAANINVYPVLKARLNPTIQLRMSTSGMGFIEIEVIEAIDSSITQTTIPISGFPIYRGKYVFNKSPNWVQDFQMEFNHNYDLLKFYGVGYSRSEIDETTVKGQAKFLTTSLSDTSTYLGFFDTHKGRLTNFWFPSNQRDIEITSAFSAVETRFDVNAIEWADYWESNTVMGHFVRFLFPDGTEKYREIISEPSSTELIIDSAIGKLISSADLPFLQVSFLWICRFGSDEIEIKKLSETISEITLGFNSIINTDNTTFTTTTTV